MTYRIYLILDRDLFKIYWKLYLLKRDKHWEWYHVQNFSKIFRCKCVCLIKIGVLKNLKNSVIYDYFIVSRRYALFHGWWFHRYIEEEFQIKLSQNDLIYAWTAIFSWFHFNCLTNNHNHPMRIGKLMT